MKVNDMMSEVMNNLDKMEKLKVNDMLSNIMDNLHKMEKPKTSRSFDIKLISQTKWIIYDVISNIKNYRGTGSFYNLPTVDKNLYKFRTGTNNSELIELVNETMDMIKIIMNILFANINNKEIDFNEMEF